MMRQTVKVTFHDGDTIVTWINGTRDRIRKYYAIGKYFNIGRGEHDYMQKVTAFEFIQSTGEPS